MGGNQKSKSWVGILKEAGSDFMEDRALRLSAAMAYYAVFSLGPLLLLVVGIAGLVFGEEAVRREIENQLKSLMGGQATGILDSMMQARKSGGSLLATIVGGIGLVLGASGVFGQLQDSLNTIWEVKPKPGGGVWAFLRNRFLSLGMVLGIGFLLLISMALTTFVHAASGLISAWINMPDAVAQALNIIAAFAVITVLFAAIFKFLPDVEIRWTDVWVGAIGTSILYTVGKFVLGWYLGRETTTSGYGAAGAFVVILLYIYYSSVILFFGAEFTQVHARYKGSRIVPSEHAVRVTEEERAQQGMPAPGRVKGGHPAIAPSKPGPGTPHHAPAFAQGGSHMHSTKITSPSKTGSAATRLRPGAAPLEQIRANPYSFLGLALGAGVLAGLVIKVRMLRRGLKWYLVARRFL